MMVHKACRTAIRHQEDAEGTVLVFEDYMDMLDERGLKFEDVTEDKD